jgi:hypothetical protein
MDLTGPYLSYDVVFFVNGELVHWWFISNIVTCQLQAENSRASVPDE